DQTYDYLISTLPLPVIFNKLRDTSDSFVQAARQLQAISILNINIGVDRPDISDQHWLYFPEDEFVFSRIGFPTNFSKSVSPPGTSSIYIEITHLPGQMPNVEETFERALIGLRKCGILQKTDKVLTRHVLDIRYAYVVFDHHRQKHIQSLTDYLESRDIYTAGRYGRWDYHSMEDSILSGKSAAEKVVAVAQPQFI